jgi:hypothetical protein
MPTELDKKKQEESLDFRSDEWYSRARERFSIINDNYRREIILSASKKPRHIRLNGYGS